jgi:hypothetical protein
VSLAYVLSRKLIIYKESRKKGIQENSKNHKEGRKAGKMIYKKSSLRNLFLISHN